MARGSLAHGTAAAEAVETAGRELMSLGVFLMSAADVNSCVGADPGEWARFAVHWEHLATDRYAAELKTRRLRRYGHFSFTPADGVATLLPHRAFVQPDDSNPFYVGIDRHFETLTDAFVTDRLLYRILGVLGRIAGALDDVAEWSATVTPFRVLGSAEHEGQPTPEGVHRDGVTLVASLLIGRSNVSGGESSVFDADGRLLMSTTLSEPGTLLLGDDRRTRHGVTAIRPDDPAELAQRDLLVITFAPR